MKLPILFHHISQILWTEMYMEYVGVRRLWYTSLLKETLNFSSVNCFIVSQMAAQEGKWVLQTHHPPVGEGKEQALWPVLTLPLRTLDRIASSHNFLLTLLPGQQAIMYCNRLRAGWDHNYSLDLAETNSVGKLNMTYLSLKIHHYLIQLM